MILTENFKQLLKLEKLLLKIMKNRFILLLPLILLLNFDFQFPCESKPAMRKKKAKTELSDTVKKKTEYEKLFSERHETAEGMITLHRIKEKLYFELPLGLLGKEMLLGSTVTQISDNANAAVGSKPKDPVCFKFSRAGRKVFMNLSDNDFFVLPEYEAALRSSSLEPAFRAFDIKAYNNDSTAVVFDVTDLFLGDEERISPFDPYSVNTSGKNKRTESFKKDCSYIKEVKSFKDNVVIKSVLSYTYSVSGGDRKIEDAPLTAVMTRSIVLLDDKPARPRLTDSRVAVFPTQKLFFDPDRQRSRHIYFANRWRLEPSDTAAYSAGETVEPVKPVVFYVDDAFPAKWKPYIMEGISQWSEAFEEIGFKNAVIAKEFPKDDPEFDPDNIKYSCVRYVPIDIQNAMGPSWVDPRSGEILNASVYVYHDVIKLLNEWLFIQTSPADERVRTMDIPEEIIGDGLRYVISHEIGHCLGFMHNMGASATVPVDSLRSPSYTQKYGTTPSIMDYARFNYVAQPGDCARGVKLTPPRFGAYDRFLVKWNYTPVPEAKDMWDEYAVTGKWLHDASADPVLRYGKQQWEIIDPRSQSEDLGDDAIKASEYGIANLKLELKNLDEWAGCGDYDYSYRKSIFNGILSQYFLYLNHVCANVGGIYLYEKHQGDAVPHYRSVPAERQRDAVRFLMEQAGDLAWLDSPAILKNVNPVNTPSDLMQELIIKMILSSPEKLDLSASKSEEADPYTVRECMDDIYSFVWGPTLKGLRLSPSQMRAQKLFLKYLGKGSGVKFGTSKEKSLADFTGERVCRDLPCLGGCAGYEEPLVVYAIPQQYEGLYFGYIRKIRSLLGRCRNHPDPETREHYGLLLHIMDKALE